MATFDDEIDPSAKYLGRTGTVTIEPAPLTYTNTGVTPKKSNVDLENLNPDIKERIKLAQEAWLLDKEFNPKGEPLPITSGRRTREQQYKEYKALLSGATNTGFMAVNPDDPKFKDKQFFHEDAVDMLPSVPNAFLEKFGLHRPFGSKDPVHVQINPKIDFKSSNPVSVRLNDDGIDPFSSFLTEKGIYVPTVKEEVSSQFSGLKNDLTNPNFYTKTLPKQAAALYDTLYSAVPGAVQFVGTPFAKLADLGIEGVNKVAGKPVIREDSATKVLSTLTSEMQQPLGKAFGITKDPAYMGEASQRLMQYIGENMEKGADYLSKETGLPKADVEWFMNAALIAGGPKVAKVTGQAVTKAGEVVKAAPGKAKEVLQNQFEALRPAENLAGRSVGAAELPAASLRKQRAAELPYPIDMEKSQLTRHPADVRFARETAKDPVFGQQFQELYAGQNALIQRNLNQFVQDTGATLTEAQPSTVGAILRSEVKGAKKAAKTDLDNSYQLARDAGEMAELVDAKPIKNYVDSLEAEAINAPVITSAQIKLKNLIDKEGGISLNNIEEVRKMVGRLSRDSSANAHFGKEINALIDQATEGKGGNLYKDARAKNAAYKNEFDDMPIMQTILGTKRGTKQHSVPVAELIDKVMIKGSAEDVSNLFNTLSKRGEAGQEIINELRGSVAQHIKNQATKGVQKDINGLPYVETRTLDTVINQLDKSDKLDLLFGKKGAEYYRTINDVTKDLQTIPKDTTNPSGSASSVIAALGSMGAETAANAAISGGYFPVPVVTGGALIGKHLYGKKVAKEKMNKISDFIKYGEEIP
jgi:hypothetical protein